MEKGVPDNKVYLTAKGIERARKTGLGLYKNFNHFDYAYHSGYLRTEQTLENILKAWPEKERNKIKIRNNPFIRERHGGYAYDITDKEATLHFPWLKDYWKTFGGFFGQSPGGESLANFVESVYLFLNMLFRDRIGQKVLVATHSGALRCLRFILKHCNYDRALN